MNPVHLRLLSQQLIAPQFKTPEELVSYMGAVQAQEYRLMRWAVEMRTAKPSYEAFRQAFDKGLLVRQHLMRGTWQLVTACDYPWMMDLFADKAAKVIQGWMKANGISISEKEESQVQEILLECTAKGRSVTKEDYAQALLDRGISMDDHRLSYHIRFAELRGLLCNGDLLPMKASYSLVSEKLDSGMPKRGAIERDEALMKLSRKFFQGRSPASLEDFIWWSGLSRRDCLRGIVLLGDEIHTETFGNNEFYLMSSGRRKKDMADNNVLLIPPYDEYLLGYKSREIVLPAEYRHKAHNRSGNFYPIITLGGIVCGNWKPFGAELEAEFFGERFLTEGQAGLLSAEWQRYLQAKTH